MFKEFEILLKYATTIGDIKDALMYEDGNIYISIEDKNGKKIKLSLISEVKIDA